MSRRAFLKSLAFLPVGCFAGAAIAVDQKFGIPGKPSRPDPFNGGPLPLSDEVREGLGQIDLKITASNPPEPGFVYTGNRRFRVFCDGVQVDKCIRVDVIAGMAWSYEVQAIDVARLEDRQYSAGQILGEREHRGHIRLERIQ